VLKTGLAPHLFPNPSPAKNERGRVPPPGGGGGWGQEKRDYV